MVKNPSIPIQSSENVYILYWYNKFPKKLFSQKIAPQMPCSQKKRYTLVLLSKLILGKDINWEVKL